jgi:hypothetical protein
LPGRIGTGNNDNDSLSKGENFLFEDKYPLVPKVKTAAGKKPEAAKQEQNTTR